MKLSVFKNLLNKVGDNVYTVEEHIQMPSNGIYTAELEHDNINDNSLAVFSGPDMSGQSISFTLTTPESATWKRTIRIETDFPEVYISYETIGDQVEADDINFVHNEIIRTQNILNNLISITAGAPDGFTWGKLAAATEAQTLAIQTQPTDQTVGAGETTTFTIVASGDGITYQWQYYDTTNGVWNNFTDGNNAVLTVVPTASWNGRKIQCLLQDVNGYSLFSDSVTLTVV